MPLIKQHRNHNITITSKTSILSLKIAREVRGFLLQQNGITQRTNFVLNHQSMFERTWELRFVSMDRVKTNDRGLSSGIIPALEFQDLRDYLIEFLGDRDLDDSVEITIGTQWDTVQTEKIYSLS